tara:strand:+ start:38 stop:1396 length:1359 start_codon:yes stop_codon:yes gene_type:complete
LREVSLSSFQPTSLQPKPLWTTRKYRYAPNRKQNVDSFLSKGALIVFFDYWHFGGFVNKVAPTNMKYEIQTYDLTSRKIDIQTKKKHLKPIKKHKITPFIFSKWGLFHGVTKAQLSRGLTTTIFLQILLGNVFKFNTIISSKSSKIRLIRGGSKLYKDFSSSTSAGEISQGLSILYFESKGYPFCSHFDDFRRDHKVAKNGESPDFVFEKTPKDRILVEAKGSFVAPETASNLKAPLAKALSQLKSWGVKFSPPLKKSYAFAVLLRELEDPFNEESLLAVVDPEETEAPNAANVPPSYVRRVNYSNWLQLMGYNELATIILSDGEHSRAEHTFFAISIAGEQYAIIPLIPVQSENTFDVRRQEATPVDIRYKIFPKLDRFIFVGMRLSVLKELSHLSTRGNLNNITSLETLDQFRDIENDDLINGSIFTDGSVIGEADIHTLDTVNSVRLKF